MTDIRIEPWPGIRGRKRILVDGVEWGSIHMESHGCHGPTYHFVQMGSNGGYLSEPSASGRSHHDISVQATGKRRRQADEPPINQLLLYKIRELIEAGKLRDPAVVKGEQKREAEAMAARNAEIEAEERREFEARADAAITEASNNDLLGGTLEFVHEDQRAILRDAIMAAMRWAQTR
jgi:hypothetical protein